MTTSTEVTVPAEATQSLDPFGRKARKADAERQRLAAQALSDRIAANYWARRVRAQTRLDFMTARIFCNDGPKGDSGKTTTIVLMMAAGNAVVRRGNILIEGTYSGLLRVNFGPNFTFTRNARTLLEQKWDTLGGSTLEESMLTGTKDGLDLSGRPYLARTQLESHAYQSDSGIDVILQPPHIKGEPIWYTPHRWRIIVSESSRHGDMLGIDTGNEPTPLKNEAIKYAHGLLMVTTTSAPKWEGAHEQLTMMALDEENAGADRRPIMTVVVNEENAPPEVVFEVMKNFAQFGPVRSIGYVHEINSTGRVHYNIVPQWAQEQYLEAYATLRQLLAGQEADIFCTDPEFDSLTEWYASGKAKIKADLEATLQVGAQQRLADEEAARQEEIARRQQQELDQRGQAIAELRDVGPTLPVANGWGSDSAVADDAPDQMVPATSSSVPAAPTFLPPSQPFVPAASAIPANGRHAESGFPSAASSWPSGGSSQPDLRDNGATASVDVVDPDGFSGLDSSPDMSSVYAELVAEDTTESEYTVGDEDTLREVALSIWPHLTDNPQGLDQAVQKLHAANRDRLGDDPDSLFSGDILNVPSLAD